MHRLSRNQLNKRKRRRWRNKPIKLALKRQLKEAARYVAN